MFSDLRLEEASAVVRKTMPYLVYRGAIYGNICAALAMALAGLGIAGVELLPVVFWALFAFTLIVGIVVIPLALRRSRVLVGIEAGEVALLTQFLAKGRLPDGAPQASWAKERVQSRFKSTTNLRTIDKQILGILRTANGSLFDVASVVPFFGKAMGSGFAKRWANLATRHIDKAVLAYTFKTRQKNVFEATEDAIVLYCQRWPTVLRRSLRLAVLGYVFALVAAIVFLIPLGMLTLLFDSLSVQVSLLATAVVIGFGMKWIFFDPVALATSILLFLEESKDAAPNAEWAARMESESGQFRHLHARALKHGKHKTHRSASNSGAAAPA